MIEEYFLESDGKGEYKIGGADVANITYDLTYSSTPGTFGIQLTGFDAVKAVLDQELDRYWTHEEDPDTGDTYSHTVQGHDHEIILDEDAGEIRMKAFDPETDEPLQIGWNGYLKEIESRIRGEHDRSGNLRADPIHKHVERVAERNRR